ncbi:thioesterase family protein [Streptomyces sp. 71268]|uniref:thioesterase family protein n=1 Tax=Streptomyces sp. 71268 TaxID=3002640 RepID=UPI0023F949BF|nr:thioesterase family protein [Streptomyces sp. 71268]WEV29315.1 thioesterase family protein [Streptomyces sp. 71268]
MSGARRPLPPHREPVRAEWIDYNGHLSEAYYVLVFGHATDALMDEIGLDADYRQRTGCSLYTVEAHVRYLREVGAGSELTVVPRPLGVDGGKVRFVHEMYAAPAGALAGAGPVAGPAGAGPEGELVATEELFALHVDQHTGRSAPLPDGARRELAARVEVAPPWAGRGIRPVAGGAAVATDG